MSVCFLRFRCSDGHTFAVNYADVRGAEAHHCAVCGNMDVEQIERQYIDAEVLAGSDVLDQQTL
jgi:hypothetical protein